MNTGTGMDFGTVVVRGESVQIGNGPSLDRRQWVRVKYSRSVDHALVHTNTVSKPLAAMLLVPALSFIFRCSLPREGLQLHGIDFSSLQRVSPRRARLVYVSNPISHQSIHSPHGFGSGTSLRTAEWGVRLPPAPEI